MEIVLAEKNHITTKNHELLEVFLKNFVSKNTQAVYSSTLKKFFLFTKETKIKSVQEISHLVAIDYRSQLLAEGLSNLTVNREVATLSSFFRYLKNKGVIFENPFLEIKRLPATTKTKAVFPLQNDVEKILFSFDEKSLHRLFFEFLSATAQRVSTILDLRKKDFFLFNEALCFNVKLKGGKTQSLPLPYFLKDRTLAILETLKDDDFLFSTDGVKPWRKSNINVILERRARKLGIRKNITPHSFRRYKLNSLLKKFDALQVAETVSFHKDINTLVRHYKKEADYAFEENPLYSYSTGGDLDYRTPDELFRPLNEVFRFTLDASASAENTKCEAFYSIENCGLKNEWHERTFINPPFSRNEEFVSKAIEEAHRAKTIVMIIPARTDTSYYHKAVSSGFLTHKIEIAGRINYDRPQGKKYGASFATIILIFNGRGFEIERLRPLGLLMEF